MNKIYKLVWSKVRNTWVVVSEKAKGHGKNASSEKNRTILKSVILMALLGSFLTVGTSSVSALTQDEEDSIVNAIIQRLETEKKIPHYLSINVPKYEASKLNYNNDAAEKDLYGIAIGAETQTNEEGIAIGRGAKIYKGEEWRPFGTGKLLWPESRQYSMNPLQEVDAEKFRGEYDIHYTRGRNGIAIGTSAQVYEAMGIAIGYKAQASAPDQNSAVAPQVAIGAFAEASGVDAIAIGTGATSRMYGGVSVGYGAFNYGKGYYGIAIGEFSRTEKEGGIALGYRAMAQGDRSLALGWYTRALYSDGVALGNGSVLDRGPTSHAYLDNDWDVKRTIQNQLSPVSIGSSRQTWGTAENKNFPHPPTSKRQLINLAAGTEDSDAVNVAQLKVVDKKVTNLSNNIDTVKPHYFSITASPTAPTSPFSNYHNNGTYNTEHALAIGEGVRAASDYSVALGYEAINQSEWTNEREPDGRPKKVTSYYSMSFLEERLGLSRFHGESAVSMVRGAHSLAIGDRAMTNDTMGIALGYKAITGVRGESNSVAPQIAIGALAEATGWSTVAMGTGATAESNNSIAIGTGAYTKKRDSNDIHSMAFGTYSRTEGTESMAFGHHAKVWGDRSIAFGAGSEAKGSSGVALGYSSVADRERSLDPYLKGEGKVSETVYGTLGAVSIGNPNEPYEYDNIRVGWSTAKGTRQLINLAAGSADTDAVNVAQLKVVDKKVDHLWTQFNMAGPHYFSVSALTRDRISNYNNDATDGSERALAIGEDVYANDYSVAIGYGAVNHDWKLNNPETGKSERVKTKYDMSGLAQRLDSDYIRREPVEFKNIGSHSVAIGDHAETNQTMSVAIGYKAQAGLYSVVKETVMPQIAIGALANAYGDSTIALGTGATATTNDSIAIGTGAHVQPMSVDNDIYSMALGHTVCRRQRKTWHSDIMPRLLLIRPLQSVQAQHQVHPAVLLWATVRWRTERNR